MSSKADAEDAGNPQFRFSTLLTFVAICAVLVAIAKLAGAFNDQTIGSLTDLLSIFVASGLLLLISLAVTMHIGALRRRLAHDELEKANSNPGG
jgi:hypothetical protein